ncbi:ParB/RepB/Spo0J family partition protein [Kineosporia sp. R_H_3]|uniref:ParB/RepB/Spo0J family partition protein n=1 Tax=Kineosporia sp. R_H_3 TaxID=1961848 RepID=UPI000B4A994A|nr:ParB/RepB/Spo0J family partition protein [Kineosporia sp. R_H_3]
MSEKRRGLGRGLGALIPNTTGTKTAGDRPVDVFFPGKTESPPAVVPEARANPNGEAPGSETAAPTSAPDAGAGTAPTNGVATEAATTAVVDLDAAGGSAAASAAAGELLPVPGARFAELPVMSIRPNPRQPRQVFDEEALAELVHSVKEIGVLQPVVVREAASEDGEARYELIMGERRWRATQEAGLDTIPAIIRETSDDVLLRDALLENLHRSQLNPLEEAAAYQQLLDDFGCTHEELATRIGRSRPQISNTIRLLRLPPLVQRRVAAGVLSAGHARALLGLDDAAAMERLAQRIVAEGLSVRMVEEIVALGDGPVAKPAKKRPRAGGHTSELNDLASRLGDRLDTKVSVALGRSKGRLSIDFASVEDLNRIIGLMSPDVKGVFQEVR